jgi:hypothetical protein
MAEYIKFRLTAAKVGVSMALMALIAGIAEKVQSSPAQVQARPAAQFLNLNNFSGNTRNAFAKVEKKLLKLDSAFVKLQQKVYHSYYTKQQITAQFLKKAEASAEFLNKADASAEFLKKADTAGNSALLGNLGPSAFFQGHGNVVSGAQTVNGGSTQQLLQTPDGAISILIGLNQPQAGGPQVPTITVRNNTGDLLPAVQDLGNSGGGSTTQSTPLKPGDNTITLQGGTSQLHLQTFPGSGGGFNSIIAVLVSLEPNPSNQGQYLASGQLLDGGV